LHVTKIIYKKSCDTKFLRCDDNANEDEPRDDVIILVWMTSSFFGS